MLFHNNIGLKNANNVVAVGKVSIYDALLYLSYETGILT
jgi:hypothetical protein